MLFNITPHALLFTIAAIGISETAYLIRKRKKSEAPVCPMGGGCATVLSSKYNHLFGVHNDILGLLFYIFFSALAALLVIGSGNLPLLVLLAKIAVVIGILMSAALTFIQWKIIKAWCFWCLMSAGTTVFLFIIIFSSKLI
jgi:uncharacterized membrane protein